MYSIIIHIQGDKTPRPLLLPQSQHPRLTTFLTAKKASVKAENLVQSMKHLGIEIDCDVVNLNPVN